MRERIGCSAVGILHIVQYRGDIAQPLWGGKGAAFIPRPNKGVKAQATSFNC